MIQIHQYSNRYSSFPKADLSTGFTIAHFSEANLLFSKNYTKMMIKASLQNDDLNLSKIDRPNEALVPTLPLV